MTETCQRRHQRQFNDIMDAIHTKVNSIKDKKPLHPDVVSILSTDDVKGRMWSYSTALAEYGKHMAEVGTFLDRNAIEDFCKKSDALMSSVNNAYDELEKVVKNAIGMH